MDVKDAPETGVRTRAGNALDNPLRPETSSLGWLLDPVAPQEFYDRYFEEAPLLVRRGKLWYFSSLPGLDAVDDLLASTVSDRLRPATGERLIRSESDGTLSERAVRLAADAAVDVQAVYRSYHDGFTVIINQVHRRSAAVGRLCRGLQGVLRHRVGANLYLTPVGAQGFSPHVDTHDVFILQLSGTKEWHVWGPSKELAPKIPQDDRRLVQGDPLTYTLSPGDTLYVPRGFLHEAVTTESSSLHLTVGLHAYRWHDLFKDALDVLADEDPSFRNALPPRYLDEPLDMERVAEMAHRVTAALTDGIVIEKAKDRIASRLVATDPPTGYSRFRSLDALADLTDDSIVARPPELHCLVRLAPDSVTIECAGNFVAGPRVLLDAFEFVAQHENFAVGDLPGALSSSDRNDIVKRLVSEGLLEVLE